MYLEWISGPLSVSFSMKGMLVLFAKPSSQLMGSVNVCFSTHATENKIQLFLLGVQRNGFTNAGEGAKGPAPP